MVHRPVLRTVDALCPVGIGGLAEALPHEVAVIIPLFLARTGVGDVGAIHELSVLCPVIEADPATAFPLGKEATGCSYPLPILAGPLLAEKGPPQKEA